MVHHDECSSNNRDAETRGHGDAGTRGRGHAETRGRGDTETGGRGDTEMRGHGTRECGHGYRVKGIQVDGLKYKLESLSGWEGRFTPAAVG